MLGARGEQCAADWYLARGYEIVDRNWRCQDGELDLVVRRGAVLVFCEVKARLGTRFGQPFEAVTPAKQARLRRLASRWLHDRRAMLRGGHPKSIRFDVASVLGSELEMLEDAFE